RRGTGGAWAGRVVRGAVRRGSSGGNGPPPPSGPTGATPRLLSHGRRDGCGPACPTFVSCVTVFGCSGNVAFLTHRPRRTSRTSPEVIFTPVFFSQASRSSAYTGVAGSRYGTPFRRGTSTSTARDTTPSRYIESPSFLHPFSPMTSAIVKPL